MKDETDATIRKAIQGAHRDLNDVTKLMSILGDQVGHIVESVLEKLQMMQLALDKDSRQPRRN